MKVLVTGSTGLVGQMLVKELRSAAHTVCRLVRPASRVETHAAPEGFDVRWDPVTGELGGAAVGADVVVNLAGASIADGRWTAERKKLLRTSRVESTAALVKALAKMAARPRVLISASAIGYYGSRGDELLNEDSEPGNDFLGQLAIEWEAEAKKADALGIRVVLARFGVILAKGGGALPRMAMPFRFGLGGRVGSGQQWMSWIALEDAVGALRFALENGAIRGPINVVAPEPVRNSDFTAALARALRRPAFFPAPAFALRLALGEMADALLLSSQRIVPQQLQRLEYNYTWPNLSDALRSAL